MWVAFRTRHRASGSTGGPLDHYVICPSEAAALAHLIRWQADPETYCAGVAKITAATEPQWLDA